MCVIIHVASIKSKHARQRRADLLLHKLKYCNFLDCRSKEGKSNFPKHRSSCRYHRKNKTTACSESVEIQMDVKVRAKQKNSSLLYSRFNQVEEIFQLSALKFLGSKITSQNSLRPQNEHSSIGQRRLMSSSSPSPRIIFLSSFSGNFMHFFESRQ